MVKKINALINVVGKNTYALISIFPISFSIWSKRIEFRFIVERFADHDPIKQERE